MVVRCTALILRFGPAAEYPCLIRKIEGLIVRLPFVHPFRRSFLIG